MTFRRALFWTHLSVGVSAGIVILLLSITGVLLTYERQIVAALENSLVSDNGEQTLPADALAQRADELTEGRAGSLVFARNPATPVTVQIDRGEQLLLDPSTAESLGQGATSARGFFHWVTEFHRWFALEGDSRSVGKAITGTANLLFVFLVVSGLYLWLPRMWKWPVVRMGLLFRRGLPTSRARDYNWHNVIGIWCLVPLFVLATTALVFSYGWANKLVYAVYGETAPERSGPPGPPQQQPATTAAAAEQNRLPLQQLLERAAAYDPDWRRITLNLPAPGADAVTFDIDTGTGGQPQKRTALTLDRASGDIVGQTAFSDNSPGQQTRIYIRFLHTGEALGIVGQTLAGIASLGACFLVYTGLALSWRRLVQPVLKRRSATLSARLD